MYCPKCRYEYTDNVKVCPDCDEELIRELPDETEEEYGELITVLETGNLATIAFAKSILDDAQIEYFVKGEELQGIFGIGALGSGYNPLVGPIEIQVAELDEDEARELLEGIEDAEVQEVGDDFDEDEESQEVTNNVLRNKTLIKILLLIVGAMAYSYYTKFLR